MRTKTIGALSLVLLVTPSGHPSDVKSQEVFDAIQAHYAGITSVRMRCTNYSLDAGGIQAEQPCAAPTRRSPGTLTRTYDIWLENPKQRVLTTETRTGSGPAHESRLYFDGAQYTLLTPKSRSGVTVQGSSQVHPPPGLTPLQAVGLCFPNTYNSTLADLLANRSNVTLTPLPSDDAGQGAQWLLEVRSLPDTIQSKDWSEKARRNVRLRYWLRTQPAVQLLRWAMYQPSSGNPEHDAMIYGKTVPLFALPDYNLCEAYVNCDLRSQRDASLGREVYLPRRVFFGNGNVNCESVIAEFAINPKAPPGTFQPAVPQGFTLTETDNQSSRVTTTGGSRGDIARVRDISAEAKRLLESDVALRAAPDNSGWMLAVVCVTVVLAATATGFFLRRRARS